MVYCGLFLISIKLIFVAKHTNFGRIFLRKTVYQELNQHILNEFSLIPVLYAALLYNIILELLTHDFNTDKGIKCLKCSLLYF